MSTKSNDYDHLYRIQVSGKGTFNLINLNTPNVINKQIDKLKSKFSMQTMIINGKKCKIVLINSY